MEAAAATPTTIDVPLTSKLSPYVKPFVPRRLQTDQSAHPNPAVDQTIIANGQQQLHAEPPASSSSRQSLHTAASSPSSSSSSSTIASPCPTVHRAHSGNYNAGANYASPGLSPRSPSYATEPRHAGHHFIPFMSGPYALQDYQTGYGLYPYPVFMFEELATPGSYVSPGTFVCPRASLQPQRRNPPRKTAFPNGNPKCYTATPATRSDVGRPTMSRANPTRNECVQGRIVENGGGAPATNHAATFQPKSKASNNRSSHVVKDQVTAARLTRFHDGAAKQQPEVTNESPRDETPVSSASNNHADVSCSSTATTTPAVVVVVKETSSSDVATNGADDNNLANSRKSKSFADIIRQKNSHLDENRIESPAVDNRRGVLCRRNSNINESVKTKTSADVHNILDKRHQPLHQQQQQQPDDSRIQHRYRNGDNGNGKQIKQQQQEHNRWTPVVSRSSRRTSENSDSSSARRENKTTNNRQQKIKNNTKTYQLSKKILPDQPDLLEHSSNHAEPGVTTSPDSLESSGNEKKPKDVDDDDDNTWTEVKSSRRWKDHLKNNNRSNNSTNWRQAPSAATTIKEKFVSDRLTAKTSAIARSSSLSSETTMNACSDDRVKTHPRVSTTIDETIVDEAAKGGGNGSSKLCNAKTFKNANSHLLDKMSNNKVVADDNQHQHHNNHHLGKSKSSEAGNHDVADQSSKISNNDRPQSDRVAKIIVEKQPKHNAERSSSKNVEESSASVEQQQKQQLSAAKTTTSTKKKKRKTDGQSKQVFKDKLKTLPSTQGKVLTVTAEFYNQLIKGADHQDQQIDVISAPHSRDFQAEEFPFLTASANCDATPNLSTLLNINSDDSWSDLECSSETTAKIKSTKSCGSNKASAANTINKGSSNAQRHEFPALGNFMEPLITSEAASYSSLLKKNFWSLPPRITPADTLAMTGGGGNSNSPAFWEKLLAESSLENFHTTKNEPSVTILNGKMGSDGVLSTSCATSSSAVATACATTKSTPAPAKRATDQKPRKPKSTSLVQINLINLLKKKEKRLKKYHTRSPHPLSSKDTKSVRKVRPFVANILDSTAPLRRRGKERERPAKKKPSALKKVILKERTERKALRDAVIKSEQIEEEIEIGSNSPDAKDSACALSDVETTVVTAKQKIHTKKFREYCNQMLNPLIDEVVQKLISDLIRFHDRLYLRDPVKAKIRRRMVVGLREVGKHMKLKKIKCLILAPNVERIQSTGGLDDAMYSVIGLAQEQNIPFVFALGRRRLGRVCLKKVPVSCVGIFNYEGSEANFSQLCELAASARDAYQRTLSQVIEGFAELSSNCDEP